MTMTLEQREAQLIAEFDKLNLERQARADEIERIRATVAQRTAAEQAAAAQQAAAAKRAAFDAHIVETRSEFAALEAEAAELKAAVEAIFAALKTATQRQRALCQRYVDAGVNAGVVLADSFPEFLEEGERVWRAGIENCGALDMPLIDAQFHREGGQMIGMVRGTLRDRNKALHGGPRRMDKGNLIFEGQFAGGLPVKAATMAPVVSVAPVERAVALPVEPVAQPTARSVVSSGAYMPPATPAPIDDVKLSPKAWADFHCEAGESRISDLYANYAKAAQDAGLEAVSLAHFGQALRAAGHESKRKESGVFFPLAVKLENPQGAQNGY